MLFQRDDEGDPGRLVVEGNLYAEGGDREEDHIVLAAALRGDWLNVLQHVGIAIIGTLFWLAASVWAMRQRGVLP